MPSTWTGCGLLKLAVGRCPQSGAALASQSTISRLENAPSKTQAVRLTAALVDQFGTSVREPDGAFALMRGGLVGIERTASTPANHLAILVLRPFYWRLCQFEKPLFQLLQTSRSKRWGQNPNEPVVLPIVILVHGIEGALGEDFRGNLRRLG